MPGRLARLPQNQANQSFNTMSMIIETRFQDRVAAYIHLASTTCASNLLLSDIRFVCRGGDGEAISVGRHTESHDKKVHRSCFDQVARTLAFPKRAMKVSRTSCGCRMAGYCKAGFIVVVLVRTARLTKSPNGPMAFQPTTSLPWKPDVRNQGPKTGTTWWPPNRRTSKGHPTVGVALMSTGFGARIWS